MINVLTVIGTRPEAIKLAPVVLELQRREHQFRSRVCLTAQHRDMADQALRMFDVRPDYDLDVMSAGQTLAQVTSRIIERLDRVVADHKPDVIVVQGDTTTVVCGALVGFYHRTSVAHVEAGLRTGSRFSPYPEEMNRRVVGHLADLHFCRRPNAPVMRSSGKASRKAPSS